MAYSSKQYKAKTRKLCYHEDDTIKSSCTISLCISSNAKVHPVVKNWQISHSLLTWDKCKHISGRWQVLRAWFGLQAAALREPGKTESGGSWQGPCWGGKKWFSLRKSWSLRCLHLSKFQTVKSYPICCRISHPALPSPLHTHKHTLPPSLPPS